MLCIKLMRFEGTCPRLDLLVSASEDVFASVDLAFAAEEVPRGGGRISDNWETRVLVPRSVRAARVDLAFAAEEVPREAGRISDNWETRVLVPRSVCAACVDLVFAVLVASLVSGVTKVCAGGAGSFEATRGTGGREGLLETAGDSCNWANKG